MNYPKEVMKVSELREMGFPEEWLYTLYRKRGQTVAWKMSNKNHSTILFDTEELEKIRKAQCSGGRGL